MIDIPNREGCWLVKYQERFRGSRRGEYFVENEELKLDIYKLEPVGKLCFWARDAGVIVDNTQIWETDEWLGHVPVEFLPFHNAVYEFLHD